jgi:tetratricopeptide (TPR) repeat protein
MASARRSDDRLMMGKFASNTGLIEVELARFAAARRNFENAHVLATSLGDGRLEANTLINLAMLDIRVDAPAAAIPRLQRARELYEQLESPAGIQIALGQLSTAYAGLGDLQRAFATIDSADVLAERHDLKRERAANLEFRGDLYRDAGDLPKALHQY